MNAKATRIDASTKVDRDRRIFEMVETSTETYREIGQLFGISHCRVREIAIRERWRQHRAVTAAAETKLPVLSRCVQLLPLSVRVRSCFSNAKFESQLTMRRGQSPPTVGIDTVSDLLLWSDEDLLSIKNFGLTSLREVRHWLKTQDLDLMTTREDGKVARMMYEKCPHCGGTGRTGRKIPRE